MDITPKHLDTFDKYYEGRMSSEEQENFEIALHSDSNLYNAFREYVNIAIGIHTYADAKSKPKPKAAPPSTPAIRVLKPYLFLAAAAFVVCLLAYPVYQDYGMLNDMPHSFGRQLNTTMGAGNVTESSFNEGLILREAKQYDAALQKFEEVKKTSNYYDNARFEKALIYLKARKYEAANTILNDIATNSEKEALRQKAINVQEALANVWFWF